MRKITLAIAALAAIGFALPVMPASAEDAVVIKADHDRDWQRHHHHKKVVVIKHDHDHDNHD